MNTPHIFNPHQQINEIVLVGLGGTGSQWARSIARIVYDLRKRRQHVPALRFVDPDRVEARNCGRQMFVENDVGQFKAEVLARRFNLAMGLSITWHNEPFNAEEHIGRYGTLLCGAVDNHLARAELVKVSGLWIDAGNHATGGSGQVVIGNCSDRQQVLRSITGEKADYHYLPNAALLFPELLEPDPQETRVPATAESCATRVERGDQRLLVNDLVGCIAAEYTFKLLNHLPITTYLTWLDLDVLSVRSVPLTRDDVLAYLH